MDKLFERLADVSSKEAMTLHDTGARETYRSGMVREPDTEKPRFDLLVPEGVPYEEQMLTRFAKCLTKGAKKYSDRNWEKADSQEEVNRMKASAFRHFMQWMTGEDDEDHAAACMFNILAAETISRKL